MLSCMSLLFIIISGAHAWKQVLNVTFVALCTKASIFKTLKNCPKKFVPVNVLDFSQQV